MAGAHLPQGSFSFAPRRPERRSRISFRRPRQNRYRFSHPARRLPQL